MAHKSNPYKKARAAMRWKWKKKRTRRLQRKRRKMRQRSKLILVIITSFDLSKAAAAAFNPGLKSLSRRGVAQLSEVPLLFPCEHSSIPTVQTINSELILVGIRHARFAELILIPYQELRKFLLL
ncbi:hypothetical protein Pmar_PMAR024740 [Perkinsus marinus ATCC 50983]|uniref:60S ribosomal protein L41 n=1 Tax=Perkinsus marinus (strain ATCC 50983 / TXsc) TaxID=423536 RepID=C5M167_PERM5|nr:hypothetical protein Pmar_PMAR024740 [Perkinsus marinus ATCC 50983]EEQ97297.1 hypothetical protein Pmar_PMAR024740 [Perkinsus marinus ATCC 50983]|eukprot:XP_002764580.1 hypothetical protein Pmar_PMAR024740 [Perkinsus marinus ATCC 50983]